MSWAPRSLFGRNFLLIVLLIALAQLGSALLVRQLLLQPRLEQIGDGLARHVVAIRAALVALPPAERAGFVEAYNRGSAVDAGDAGHAGASERRAPGPLTLLERRFVRTISPRLAAEGAEIVWRREAGRGLALQLAIDNERYWLVLPGVLPAREFSGTWIAASLGGVGLALIGAFAIQRRLNRPLARVVAAADELARGAAPQPLPEDGPLETATLARSVNQLVASLAQADRERALMLAGVSHDLRTPLAKLRLGVEILADRSEPELTASMNRSVDEMDAIVGQFLDFARGVGDEPFALGDVDALARAVATASADHGQPVALQLGSTPRVRLREQALRRCVTNLVENAFKHGRAPVAIDTGHDAATVWIEVSDHGDGMAPHEAEALKQPFRRAHAARSGAPGAGLGLAIVDRLVRAQGGRFELLTNSAQGLRARIELPR